MDDLWRPLSPTAIACPSPAGLHLWWIALDPLAAVVERLLVTLDPDERGRADRFRTETLRRRFVVGRGALRSILGAYLSVAPEDVAFEYGMHGKPAIAGSGVASDPERLDFNLAHTEDLALCGVTVGRAVGVDVESVRPLLDGTRIIARYFSAREQSEYLRLPKPEQPAAFFRGWSRKEAYLKATGAGISAGLDTFDVALAAGVPALLRVGDDPDEAARWTIMDIDVGPGFAAAVAALGPIDQTEHWRWEASNSGAGR